MSNIYVKDGTTVDEVETLTNTPGVMTPALKIQPQRGTWLRFVNRVAKGVDVGIPLYMKLRDAGGNLLPANTEARFEAEEAGMNDRVKVSEQVRNLTFWNQNGLTTQRDVDNVDSAKVVLQWPENAAKTGPRDHLDVVDTGALYLAMDAPVEVDWTTSEFYVDRSAITEYQRR